MNTDKTYVVTGVSSGIGAETCQYLKAQGASVIGVDQQETAIADQFLQADLSDAASIDALIDTLPGDLDGLANIAGVPPTVPAPMVLKVNLYGAQRLTQGLIPKFAKDASIVNIGSLAGRGWSTKIDQVKATLALGINDDIDSFCEKENLEHEARSYFLCKEAMIVWTMQQRWAWRDRGINMNIVSPGPVETPILADFFSTLKPHAAKDIQTMDRLGATTDIAPIVAFLLSDAANWMRGVNLPVDGGMASHLIADHYQF